VLDILFKLALLALWKGKDLLMAYSLCRNMLFATIQRR